MVSHPPAVRPQGEGPTLAVSTLGNFALLPFAVTLSIHDCPSRIRSSSLLSRNMNNMNNILGTMADAYEADAFNVLTHYRGIAAAGSKPQWFSDDGTTLGKTLSGSIIEMNARVPYSCHPGLHVAYRLGGQGR